MSGQRIELNQAQKKSRRARNVALAMVLVGFVLLVYVGTWAKLGANVLSRSL